MLHHRSLVSLALAAALVMLAWPATADAQRRGRPYGYYPYVPYGWYGPYGQFGYPYLIDASSSLRIDVDPQDAEVYVDGYFAGYVDEFDNPFQSLSLTPGGHEIVVYHEEYESLSRRIYARPYRSQTLRESLVPLPPGSPPPPRPTPADVERDAGRAAGPPEPRQPSTVVEAREPRAPEERQRLGSLSLVLSPADADVFIDGEPFARDTADARVVIELTVGRHAVEVRRAGLVTFRQDVLIREGRTLTLRVTLKTPGAVARRASTV